MSGCSKADESSRPLENDPVLGQRSNNEIIEITEVVVDSCCVSFRINTNIPPTSTMVPFHNIKIYNSQGQIVSNTVQNGLNMTYDPLLAPMTTYWYGNYCTDELGTYTITSSIIGAINPVGPAQSYIVNGSASFTITEACKDENFGQYLCWEDFALQIRTVNGIIIERNGVEIDILLGDIFIVGGFQAIYNAIDSKLINNGAMINPPFMGNFADSHSMGPDCTKGGAGPLPGLFFWNSNYNIKRIYGRTRTQEPTFVNFKDFSY